MTIDLKIEPGLFFSTYDRLLNDGYIKGSISGGRVLDRAVFVPDIYIEATERFLKSFYYQNGYLELSAVKKLPADPKISLQRLLLDDAESLIYLKTVVLSRELYDQIENTVHESMKKHSWVAVEASVNIPLEKSDVGQLVSLLENKHKDWTLCDRNYFYQHNLVDKFLKIFEPLCIDKASKESVNIAKLLRSTREGASIQQEMTKKSKGAGAKKRKGDKNRDTTDDWSDQPSANDNDQLIFMMRGELIKYLTDQFCDDGSYPVEILGDICSRLYSKLNALYREHAESIYVNTQSSNSKKGHGDFKEKFRLLYQNICLFDAGTSIFNDSVSEQLKSFLLRTLCTDLVNLAISFYCHSPNSAQLTPKVRDSMIDSMASDVKVAFRKTIQSLNTKNLDAFFDAVDEISAPNICSLSVRRPDKKLRSEIVMRYQMELLSQLNECQDESTGLLSACLFLISKLSSSDIMVHASGKFVPQMVQLLHDKIPKSLHQLLTENQKLVVQKLKAPNDENVGSEVKSKFEKLKQEIFDTYANVSTS
uniref:E3 UFM1-protein ligase 1 homolog n=1 Tax=Romanomermis culicivorax TaxID=13658 RepID=A0A915K4N2_ROMCU